MAFPLNPTNGQTYTTGGYTYQYNAVLKTWTKVATTSSTIGNVQLSNGSVTTGNTSVSDSGLIAGNTSVTSTGITTGNTSVTSSGITTGNTSVTSTGITAGNTSVTGTGITTGNTSVTGTGITTGNTAITGTSITTGNTSITDTGLTAGNTTVTSTGLTTGNTSITNTGLTTGNTSITSTGLTTGNTTISSNSIVVGSSSSNTSISNVGITTSNLTTTGTASLSNVLVTGDIIPTANVTYNLGNATNRWKDLYLSGNTIDIGGGMLEIDGNTFVLTNPAGGKFIIDGNVTVSSELLSQLNSGNLSNVNTIGILNLLNVTGNITTNSAVQANQVFANSGNIGNLIVGGDISIGNVVGNILFKGGIVDLGEVANVKIHGGTSGQYLQTDGTGNLSWHTVSGGAGGSTPPGGANTQVQFNDEDSFGGNANLTFNKTTGTLYVANVSVAHNADITGNLGVTGNITGSNITITGTLATGNITANNITANNFTGNLTGSSNTAITVTGNAQPNITSLGALVNLTVTGNVLFSGSNVSLGSLGNLHIDGGSNGQALLTDGAGNLSWVTVGRANVSGSNTQIQFNDAGAMGASANFTFDKTSNTLTADNITSNKDVTVGGNLIVQGTTTTVNSVNTIIKDPIIEQGGGTSGAALTTNDNKDRGSLLHYYNTSPVDAFMGWDNSNAEFVLASNVSAASDIITINSLGKVRAGDAHLNSLVSGNLNTSGNLDVDGQTRLGGNLTVAGNITFTGSVSQISGNSGQFFGDSHGVGALYAGISSGYAAVFNPIIQASADANEYVQINFQNINHGNKVSTDYCATSDNGDDTKYFIDMGIAGSTWDGSQENSVGTAAQADDGYLYVQGYGSAGNLILGTVTPGTGIKFLAGGPNSGNIVATINHSGANITGNLGVTGNITANYLIGNGSQLTGIVADSSAITSLTGLTALTVNGPANLGDISNVHINGGTAGYVIQTDGTGNLTWVPQTSSTTMFVNNFTGDGANTQFTLSSTPDSVNAVSVNYNGASLLRSSFSLSGANIVFSSAPANGSAIEVTVFQTLGTMVNLSNVAIANLTTTSWATYQQTTDVVVAKTGATGVVVHDMSTSSVFYHSSIAANFTVNLTNVPTTNNRTIVVALILSQGSTAYIPSAVQIGGSAQTILWAGATVPMGTPNNKDIVSFTLLRVSNSWIVMGSLGTFG